MQEALSKPLRRRLELDGSVAVSRQPIQVLPELKPTAGREVFEKRPGTCTSTAAPTVETPVDTLSEMGAIWMRVLLPSSASQAAIHCRSKPSMSGLEAASELPVIRTLGPCSVPSTLTT